MKQYLFLISLLFLLVLSSPLWARPLKGFNEGPYLCLEGGITQVDFDKDEQTGLRVGHEFEPVIGLIFGWNIWDWFSAELEGRYGTNIKSGRREHQVGVNITGKYFVILDALTDFPTLRILPTVRAGIAFRVASLPSSIYSTDSAVTKFGLGPSFGAGLSFLWKKYFSFGIDVQENLLFFNDTRQDITVNGTSIPNALIYKGGFIPQFSAMGFVGVHF